MPVEKTTVVDIRFSFYNKDVLRYLRKRGQALLDADEKKKKRYERKLDEKVAANFDYIRTPHVFYVTFEHSSACQAFLELKTLSFRDGKIKLSQPEDPTDIEWENSARDARLRYAIFVFFLLFSLAGTIYQIVATFTISMNQMQEINYLQNPPNIDCQDVNTRYGQNLVNMAYAEFQYLNLNDFNVVNSEGFQYLNEKISRTGALGCFCKQMST